MKIWGGTEVIPHMSTITLCNDSKEGCFGEECVREIMGCLITPPMFMNEPKVVTLPSFQLNDKPSVI
jgi:hypothetical protein